MAYDEDRLCTIDPWDWQEEDYCLGKDTNFDVSNCLWDGVMTNGEDISYMFEEATPVKACGDLAYHVDVCENIIKEQEKCREISSQVKRRRMLQFNTQLTDSPLSTADISCAYPNSKEMEDSIGEALHEISQWTSGFADDVSASGGHEGLDLSPEGWLTECLNEAEFHLNCDDINFPGASDVHIDIAELCNIQPEDEANTVRSCAIQTPQKPVFRGRKSCIRAPKKSSGAVASPFAFVKPYGAQGNMSLKDINQWIRTPPRTELKQNRRESPVSYPTSAFSGKPVVGKTKIRTEGGKGCITIMRTKG